MLRNVSGQKWRVYAWDTTTGQAKTGDAANISAYITKDFGTPAATNDTAPTEVSSTNEPGYYEFDLTQAETNAHTLSLAPKSGTSDVAVIPCQAVVNPIPQYLSLLGIESDGDITKVNTLHGHTAQSGDNYVRIGANGAGLTEVVAASVTGAVGSVTGNVGGSVASVTGGINTATGTLTTLDGLETAQDTQHGLTRTDIGNLNDPSAAEVAEAVEAAILDEGDATALLAAIAAKVEEFINDDGDAAATMQAIATAVWANATRTLSTSPPTASQIADAVCDEALSGHTTAGTLGKAVSDTLADTNELQGNQGDWATATSVTVSDKTGFKLASDGLDSIAVTRPSAKATTFPAMVVQLFYRFFGKTTLDADDIKTYAADGTTVVTTQAVSDDGTTQTQGEAS